MDLITALRDPRPTAILDGAGWTRLLARARQANLLGALARRISDVGLRPPPVVARHLDGAAQVAERQRLSVAWETHQLQRVLGPLGIPVVLLKGAAYVMSPAAMAPGRTFGDIDILVPEAALGDVESQLMLAGWVSAKTDAYDQRYYRQWMHELPPMTHLRRATVLDVHHRLLPRTARHAPDPQRLIARASSLPALPAIHVPAPEDLLAHSLTHLMHEGELHNGLRDLHDVDEMARRFGAVPGFWPRFAEVVRDSDLARPVGLGLQLAREVFDAPLPADLVPSLLGGAAPAWLIPVYRRALGLQPSGEALAQLIVYVRAHALRMPAPMLLRHLSVKAWQRLRPEPADAGVGPG